MARKWRSDKEIKAEIKRLETMKPRVRRYTAFGDDNHRKIDVILAVLRDDLDEEEINSRFHDPDENSEAYQTRQWMDGEELDDGSPADQWQSLVRE